MLNETIDRPKVHDLLRKDLLESLRRSNPSASAADRRRVADEMMARAHREGTRLRVLGRQRRIDALRSELRERGLRGSYPKGRWAKLRRLEAEHRADPGVGEQGDHAE